MPSLSLKRSKQQRSSGGLWTRNEKTARGGNWTKGQGKHLSTSSGPDFLGGDWLGIDVYGGNQPTEGSLGSSATKAHRGERAEGL